MPARRLPYHRARWALLLFLPLLWLAADLGWGLSRREAASRGDNGWLTPAENEVQSLWYRLRGERDAPVRVVYVDVDSASTAELGNFPWDRGYFAEVCDALTAEGGAAAVGLDFVFSDRGQPRLLQPLFLEGNAELARLLAREPRIVLGASYASTVDRDAQGRLVTRSLPLVAQGWSPGQPVTEPELPRLRLPPAPGAAGEGPEFEPPATGLIDSLGSDLRWVPLFSPGADGRPAHLHLSLELALRFRGLAGARVEWAGDRLRILSADTGRTAWEIPLRGGQLVEVNWHGRWDSPRNPRASFIEVLRYALLRREADPAARQAAAAYFSQFRGAVVLLGPVDPLLQDIAPTPYDRHPVPRVDIHGNLVKMLVADAYLQRLPPWARAAAVLALSLGVTGLAVFSGGRGWRWHVGAFAAVVGYAALAGFLFVRGGWCLPVVAPLGGAFSTSFVAVAWMLVSEQRQKGRIKSLFGTYVSPQLVDRMVESGEDPQLGGAEMEITAYFSDIQSFSRIAERLDPPRLVELMNEYLTACTGEITAQSGTLDKYVGDAVVAMFGAPVELPNHARHACEAALAVQARNRELRRRWQADGRAWPAPVLALRTRIGLNTGRAVVGNMGSRTRFNYTMMGDTVNIAARLEGAGRFYGVYILCAEGTKDAAEQADRDLVFRFLDRVVVKGRDEPLSIYELVGRRPDLSQDERLALGAFVEGRSLYEQGDFAGALARFEEAAQGEPLQPERDAVESNPSLVFARRCRELIAAPPERWSTLRVFEEK